MELRPLQSCYASSIPRTGLIEKQPFVQQVPFIKLPTTPIMVYPNATNLKLVSFRFRFRFRAQASSATTKSATIPNNVDSKDENLIFVAGATGKVGSRTVRELLKLGFRVRAGVRSVQRAESLAESVKQMKLDEGTQPIEKLDVVQCDLEKQDQIGPALGNASAVICCIGASEKEVFDVTGPYRIDYQATKNLIDAATVAKVNHFILLTSLGTNKVGFPAAILNLFWGVLIWKRKAEEALLASGIPYTIVRPGGMERPTDSYKETHNITLSLEDTLFGGQVSNLQVAELMAFMAKNRSLSYCKVVEVIAETTAPLTPMGELLAKIPSQRAGSTSQKEGNARLFYDINKGPSVADGPLPAISKSVSSETPKTSPVKEPTEAKATVASTVKEPTEAKATMISPLSPYVMYEDLKPPTSPTPTTPSSTTKAVEEETISSTTNSAPPPSVEIINSEPSSIVIEKEEAIQTEVKKPSPLSPYICYEDLKPPVSPTPKAPNAKKEDNANVMESVPEPTTSTTTTTTDSVASKVSAEVAATDEHKSAAARVSLSPYAAYADLKPPTSPMPSPRK